MSGIDLSKPFTVASAVIAAANPQSVFEDFRASINESGLGNAALVVDVDRKNLTAPPAEKIFGYMVDPQLHQYLAEVGAPLPAVAVAIATGGTGFVDRHTQPLEDMQPDQRHYHQVMFDLGFHAGAIFGVVDRAVNSGCVLLLDWNQPNEGFRRRVTRQAVCIHQCAVNFYEALRVREIVGQGRAARLTPRERDCVSWACAGKSSKEIGDLLKIATATVNEYLRSAQRKLGASNRAQTIARSFLLNEIDP